MQTKHCKPHRAWEVHDIRMAAPQRRRLCVCYPAAAAQKERHGSLLLVLSRAAQEGSRAGARCRDEEGSSRRVEAAAGGK